MRRIGLLVLLLCLCGTFSLIQAGVIYNISMTTAALIGHPAGPFSLEFQLNDGSGTGDANNTAVLSSFLFGGGNASGGPTLTGGASGSLSTSVNLTDSNFFNQFIQGFTPGSSLKFQLSLTTNVDSGGIPDQFSFSILDKTGTEIPTLAPSFFDVFVQIDINPLNPMVQTFASDTSRSPAGGGGPIAIAASIAAPAVPEANTMVLVSSALAGLCVWRRRYSKTPGARPISPDDPEVRLTSDHFPIVAFFKTWGKGISLDQKRRIRP